MNSKLIGEAIRARRMEFGWSQPQLADKSDTDQSSVSRAEAGEFKKLSENLLKIVHRLGLVLPEIDPSFDAPPLSIVDERGRVLNPPPSDGTMKLYGTAEGGRGALIFSSEPIEFIQKPPILLSAPNGYGVIVKGESMVPAFRSGDIALVNPHQPASPDCEVILQRVDEDGTRHGIIKTLLRLTEAEIKYQQWNKPKTFTVKRGEWPECHLVVGKYSRR